MDVDRFISMHKPAWDRLAYLSKRGRNGGKSLEPDELDELVHLYQRVSGHLAHARVAYRDPSLDARLTTIVADANAAIYSTRTSAATAIRRFVFSSFPGAVWRIRRFVLASALLTLVPGILVGAWIANSDAALDASGPEAVRAAYVEEEFADYYSSEPAAQFAAGVTFNNIRVAITAFALGIFACVGTAAILVFNGANVGVAGGLFAAVGEQGRFWGLILPHGLLELTAVIVAGGAGLRLGWALIDPGDRTRIGALTDEGRRSVLVVLGLIGAFVVAGLIEGFVTGSPLPTAARIAVGVAVEAAFLAYIFRFGRSAESEESVLAGI
ncbi:stage II sporulation protein M [Actinospongicola halichondriae]|uniref:stage II sporulation protein M n=1 Tax=Actinospongicola halichondriae TaxID=3236844 RepID=UPI003D46652C